MKTKVLIIAFLIVSLLGAFTLKAKAQIAPNSFHKSSGTPSDIGRSIATSIIDSTLIADETNLTYLKTGAKLVTYSEAIFQKISLKFGDQFKAIHIYYKKDRHGPYKEYQITIPTELANTIKEWSKTNL